MSDADINKIIYSAAVVLVIQLSSHLFKRVAKRTQHKYGIRKSRYFAIKRFITTSSLLLSCLALILIWNVNIKHAWVSLSGIMALIAIAFFAIWSLVGNILAGIIIYFTSPFRINDTIEVMPDAVRGRVLAINTFYTVLEDADLNYINIPNSQFFQKYIKVIKSKRTERRNSEWQKEESQS